MIALTILVVSAPVFIVDCDDYFLKDEGLEEIIANLDNAALYADIDAEVAPVHDCTKRATFVCAHVERTACNNSTQISKNFKF